MHLLIGSQHATGRYPTGNFEVKLIDVESTSKFRRSTFFQRFFKFRRRFNVVSNRRRKIDCPHWVQLCNPCISYTRKLQHCSITSFSNFHDLKNATQWRWAEWNITGPLRGTHIVLPFWDFFLRMFPLVSCLSPDCWQSTTTNLKGHIELPDSCLYIMHGTPVKTLKILAEILCLSQSSFGYKFEISLKKSEWLFIA